MSLFAEGGSVDSPRDRQAIGRHATGNGGQNPWWFSHITSKTVEESFGSGEHTVNTDDLHTCLKHVRMLWYGMVLH